jgi:lipoprotein NlpD
MKNQFNFLLIFIVILISGCASKFPIPIEGEIVKKEEKKEKCPDVYKVKAGETLFSISLMCGFNYQDVAKANGLVKPYKLKKGDFIRFDLLRKKDAVDVEKPIISNEVETLPLDEEEDMIIEEPQIFAPVQIKGPKVIRDIYSSKSLKKANKIVADRKKLSSIWISPTDGKVISNFDTAKRELKLKDNWGKRLEL